MSQRRRLLGSYDFVQDVAMDNSFNIAPAPMQFSSQVAAVSLPGYGTVSTGGGTQTFQLSPAQRQAYERSTGVPSPSYSLPPGRGNGASEPTPPPVIEDPVVADVYEGAGYEDVRQLDDGTFVYEGEGFQAGEAVLPLELKVNGRSDEVVPRGSALRVWGPIALVTVAVGGAYLLLRR